MTALLPAASALAQQQTPWKAAIAPPGEHGERMFVSGKVLDKATGKPISNAEVYIYQADRKGIYGESPRTPRLKATLYTRSDGYYEFSSIRPGSYANESNPKEMLPAHVHYVIFADGYKEWEGELVFEDDPLLTPERRAKIASDTSTVLRPITKDAKGVWQVVADVGLAK
jgi:protocatechuate 3,4-dioxygenase beta subunit